MKDIVEKPTHIHARVVVMARVRKHRQAQGQARQMKGNRENRYVIKVVRLNREGSAVPLAFGPREPKDAPSLFIGQ